MAKTLSEMIHDEAENIAQKTAALEQKVTGTREAYVTATLILGSAQRLEAWSKLALDHDEPGHSFSFSCPACKESAAAAAADCMRRIGSRGRS